MPDDAGDPSPAKSDSPGAASPGAVPPAALREDQIENAVGFLSHPKVRGSAVSAKRSFLQQKGLTEGEIDEAFRRVPESALPAAAPPATAPASSALATTAQHLQPAPYSVAPPGAYPPPPPHALAPQEQPLRWTQVALGAGFAAAGAYAVKSLVWPFVADTVTSWRGRCASPAGASPPSAQDAAAVADAIRAQSLELAASIQTMKELVAALDSSRGSAVGTPAGGAAPGALTAEDLRQELRAFAATLNDMAAPQGGPPRPPGATNVEAELADIKGLLTEYLQTPRSDSNRTPADRSVGNTPGSYASATERILSGAPSPAQHLPPRSTPGGTSNGSLQAAAPGGQEAPVPGRHPTSYMDVLEMLEQGQTPPGIRTDINDKPPNPAQPPPAARMKPPPKPWERAAIAAGDTTTTTLPPLPTPSLGQISTEGGSLSFGARPGNAEEAEEPGSPAAASSAGGVDADEAAAAAAGLNARNAPSPRRPASIYEAATSPSAASRGVIAGRLSPARPPGYSPPARPFAERAAVFNGDGDGEAQALPAPARSLFADVHPDNPHGSGLGRPLSKGWKPPPIPVPTLSGEVSPGEAAAQAAAGARGGSAASLGEDFTSA